jgi:ADP-heptose:LPS heptosyltransferase
MAMTAPGFNPKAFLEWRIRFIAGALARMLPAGAGAPVRRVCCVLNGGLGDKLMALPAVRHLKQKYPDAEFRVRFIGGAIPRLDLQADCCSFRKSQFLARLGDAARGADVFFVNSVGVFDVWNEVCALASRAALRIGPVISHLEGRAVAYNRPFIYGTLHETVANFNAVSEVSADGPLPYPLPGRHIVENRGRIVVGLHVGSSPGGEAKRWPVEHFRALVRELEAEVDAFLVLGSESERELLEKVALDLPKAEARISLTFEELAGSVLECDALVCNDSGIAHLAAALGKPAITLMAATDPVICAPVSSCGGVLSEPCSQHFCYWSGAECEHCIARIQPDRVAGALRDILAASR